MKNLSAAVVLLGATVFASPAFAHEGWIGDFDKAVTVAKEQNKDLLVDFTGSDWCGWCIRLNEEVFDHDVFRESITKDYILVSLDYPRSEEAKAKVPNPARNAELAAKYGVRGYPTILLMNADGIAYGQTGYQAGGPEAYLEHIADLRTSGLAELAKVEVVVKAYSAAPQEGKIAALGKVLDAIGELPEDSPFASILMTTARDAFTLDPKNEAGLKLRTLLVLSKAGEHSKELLAMAIELDPKNASGAYESAVWAKFKSVTTASAAKDAMATLDGLNPLGFQDKETGFLMNLTAATWSARGELADSDRSKGFALKAKGIGHEDPEMLSALDELLGDAN